MTSQSSLRPIGSHAFFPGDAEPILETDEATYLKSGYLIFNEEDKYPEAFERFSRNDGFGENWVEDKYLTLDSYANPVALTATDVTGDTDGNQWIVTNKRSSLFSSTDGLNWSIVLTENTDRAEFDDVSYLGNMWVATLKGSISSRPYFYKSFDGVTWSKVFVGSTTSGTLVMKVAYGNGIYLAMSDRSAGTLYKSTDNFDSYTEVSVPSVRNIVFAKDRFFAHYLSALYRSTDGETWTQITLPASTSIHAAHGVAAVGERVVFTNGTKDLIISNPSRSAFTTLTLPNVLIVSGNNILVATNDTYLDVPVRDPNDVSLNRMLRIDLSSQNPTISQRVGGEHALMSINRTKTLSTGKSSIWYRDIMLPAIVGTQSNIVNGNLTLTFPYPEFPMSFLAIPNILSLWGTSYVRVGAALVGHRRSYGGAYVADFAYAISVVGRLPVQNQIGYLAQGGTTSEYIHIVRSSSTSIVGHRTVNGGSTWATINIGINGTSCTSSGIVYFNGTWITAAHTVNNGTTYNALIRTSTNGTSWTSRLSQSGYGVRGIASNGNVVVVSIYSPSSNPPERLHISTDGTTFTVPTYPFGSGYPAQLITVGDKIVAFVGDSVYSTLNGSNWTLEGNMGHPWAGDVSGFLVDEVSGTVLLVRQKGRGMVLSSNNLKDWKVVRNPSDTGTFTSIGRTYNGDAFIISGGAYHASPAGPSIGIKVKHDEGSATKYLRIK